MVMIFSWDPSFKIINNFSPRSFGGRSGGGSVFATFSEFSRHSIRTICGETTLQRNDFVGKLPVNLIVTF